MRFYHRIFLFFGTLFFSFWIAQVILARFDYMLNIQRMFLFPWVYYSLVEWDFSVCSFSSFSMGGIYKVLLSLMALMGIFFLSLAGAFSDEYRFIVDEIDDYRSIIVDRSFLFTGNREIYQQMNGLVSKKLIVCENGDDYDCQYEKEEDQLRIDVYYEKTIFRSE